MTPELLSIIAIIMSGATAVCSTTIPAIISYKTKKAELKAQKKREEEQAYNAKFEAFYQKHFHIINDFSTRYENWKLLHSNKSEFLVFINNIAPEFPYSIRNYLYDFANKIKNNAPDDDLDSDYDKCRQLILDSYGVSISASTPSYLLSDILRIVLKERFDELQHASSKDLKLHHL